MLGDIRAVDGRWIEVVDFGICDGARPSTGWISWIRALDGRWVGIVDFSISESHGGHVPAPPACPSPPTR